MSNFARMQSQARDAKPTLDQAKVVTEKVVRGIIEKGPLGEALERLGLVLVPFEPTGAMIEAACSLRHMENDVLAIWHAMVEASQEKQDAPASPQKD